MIDAETKLLILKFQQVEIAKYDLYQRLAQKITRKNREMQQQIADDEKRHHNQWKKYAQTDFQPKRMIALGLNDALVEWSGALAMKLLNKE
ncbi:MAG: hypothetical protein JSW07_19080 [bacterium]|nr:MAG: hypothetical protein JSW07_19080 [bacterium]